jgi:uracil-DNA glycosylase
MSPDTHSPGSPRRSRSGRAAGEQGEQPTGPEDLRSAYERRAIAEMAALNDEITAAAPCRDEDELPVLASGSPQAEIMLVKWAPNLAERQEGVAFFGRAGTAVLKSMQRLGIDPLVLYGTLCVKCGGGEGDDPALGEDLDSFLPWLSREVQIVQPALIVPMGERVVEAINRMGHPMAQPLSAQTGEVQSWTPSIEALYVPDIDASLDEQNAKRAFWNAFRAVGDWHQAQPPY